MSVKVEFIENITERLAAGTLSLPSLPDVAIKVRQTLKNEDCDLNKMAELIATDPAITASLVKLANSPLYRGAMPITSIKEVVMRLGSKRLSDLVTAIAIKQVFTSTSKGLNTRLRSIWETAVDVAKFSQTIASQVRGFDPEVALLAGLTHNIGSLPIIQYAAETPAVLADESIIDEAMDDISALLGEQILLQWGFSIELANVPAHVVDIYAERDVPADYADIVIAASQEIAHLGDSDTEYQNIPAYTRLGLHYDSVNDIDIDDDSISALLD